MRKTITTQLFDNSGETDSGPLEVEIEYGEGTIDIRPKGYGDACSKDGYGTPILVEFWNGELRVVVWGDINKEDPTHTVVVEGAKESNRRYCSECGQLWEAHNSDGSCVRELDDEDKVTAMCPYCGFSYVIKDGHRCQEGSF